MKQKTLKFYFIKSLRWILFHTLHKFNGRLYTILFNLYATLFGLSGRIYYKNKFFYVNNDLGLNFRFFHRKVGLNQNKFLSPTQARMSLNDLIRKKCIF